MWKCVFLKKATKGNICLVNTFKTDNLLNSLSFPVYTWNSQLYVACSKYCQCLDCFTYCSGFAAICWTEARMMREYVLCNSPWSWKHIKIGIFLSRHLRVWPFTTHTLTDFENRFFFRDCFDRLRFHTSEGCYKNILHTAQSGYFYKNSALCGGLSQREKIAALVM